MDIDRIKLRLLAEKIEQTEWFVEHAATEDGLSRIDDGREYGMHPIYGEAHEIEFAAACVNYVLDHVVPLTSAEQYEKECREAGECERSRQTPSHPIDRPARPGKA